MGEYLEQSSRVQAVVDYYGPTDFVQMDAHRPPDGMVHDPADSPESLLVGGHGHFTDPAVPAMTKEFLARHLRPAADK